MGDVRKNILQTDFEGKKAYKEKPGKNNILHWKEISFMTSNPEKKKLFNRYRPGKKFLTPEVSAKKFLPIYITHNRPHYSWSTT